MFATKRRSLLKGALASPLLSLRPTAAQSPRVVRIALSATNENTLDPRRSIQNADQFVSRQVFDALLDPPDGTFDLAMDQVVKELVTAVEISPDSRQWTLTLKQGVKFHRDNGEMTAEDVRFTYEQILDPKWGSPQRIYVSNIDAVEALSPSQVRFSLKCPDPDFHASGLISLLGSIVSRKAYEASLDGFARAPVGTGAFAFDRIDINRGIILNAFDGYHGGRPKIDTLEVRYMADPTARTLGFIKGDLHVIEGARLPGWLGQVRQQKPDTVVDITSPGSVNTVFFNLGRKPFDNVLVRRALRYAIDRDTILAAFDGIAGPAWGINPPDFPGALGEKDVPAELRYDYDPDRAKALLREAGLPNGFRFSIIMTQREDYASLMLILQEMWRKIGVEMAINTVDHTSYHTQKARDVNAVVMNSESFAPVSTQIPLNCYSAAASVKADGTGNGNYSHYGAIGGPGIDDTLQRALAEPDPTKRQALVREVELKILADMPAFTLCTLGFIYLRNPALDLGFPVKAGYSRYRFARASLR